MENKDNEENKETNRMAKAPLADEKHKLKPSVTGGTNIQQDKEPGKLPDPEKDFGVDHNSDPVISKTP